MAKLFLQNLGKELKKDLAPVYLISGEETLLVEESGDAIREAARKQGFIERERYFADNQFDWNMLANASSNLSLFGDKKIIELRIPNAKPGDKGSKFIVEYLSNPSPDNLLLIITGKIEGSSRNPAKWIKTIEKVGHWLPIWPLMAEQLPDWIGQRIKQTGLSADRESIEILASRTEGNLLATHQEIEKLKLLSTDGYLSPELVSGAVADSARFDLFGMIDKIMEGDARAAARQLQGLRNEGIEPVLILWGLTQEVRKLLSIHQHVEQGRHIAWAAKQQGIWERRVPLVQRALKRLSAPQLISLLRQANGIDKAIKGLRRADPWNELMELVLGLASSSSLTPQNHRLSLQL